MNFLSSISELASSASMSVFHKREKIFKAANFGRRHCILNKLSSELLVFLP